nr:hypothetical protein 33 [bacterium]
MAVTNSDLLLVQRGSTPMKAEASVIADYVKDQVDASDIEIASASQLGVIRVGQNLDIDPVTGVLDAILPAGLEYQGVWVDPSTVPTNLQNGYFWIWDGGDGVALNNASWGSANGTVMNDGDKIFYDGSQFDVVPVADAGVMRVDGTLPIQVDNSTDPAHPNVSIVAADASNDGYMSSADWVKLDSIEAGAEANVAQNLSYDSSSNRVEIDGGGTNATIPVATASQDGLMSSQDKSTLDGLVASPGGVLSVVEGDGINVDNTNAGAPVVSVEFGAAPGGDPKTVMPYDISLLAELT